MSVFFLNVIYLFSCFILRFNNFIIWLFNENYLALVQNEEIATNKITKIAHQIKSAQTTKCLHK
jgi:hypothetical protein